ncbi:MAG: ORF6N domain-containing protein [Elusimicrobia bacterium]|nr:ORF6N domain-containing protein [Elusimicrobiota bacterium]
MSFHLTWEETRIWWSRVMSERLRSQIVTLKRGQHIKFRPRAFTEHGILMFSSILNSERCCFFPGDSPQPPQA